MTAKKFTRRDFLKISGLATGATVLTCTGVNALARQSPQITFPSSSCGDQTKTNKVLITYASKCGSTAEIAQTIGQTISKTGAFVEVLPIALVSSLSSYQTVFLGSAIRRGSWLPEAKSFIANHQQELGNMPTAWFTVCMTLYQDTPENRQKVKDFLQPVREIFQPQSEGYFAGKVDPKKLSLLDNTILNIIGVPEGDYRNWNTISQSASETCRTWL
ncbi:MAG: twin-arginine translocation signal domain-containing protein [Anaerolineales bacterium]|nr:twin-arginine translocation signal domain-containing protein [Anaerolineales bacterium]